MERLEEYLGYWAPHLLAASAAFLAGTASLPSLSPAIGLRRWYHRLMILAWGVVGLVVLLTVALSSPWLGLGILMTGLVLAIVGAAKRRLEGRMEQEALDYLHGLVGIMSAGEGIVQTLRLAVRDPDFGRVYPRMSAQARQIIGYVDAGRALSNAIVAVVEGIPASARPVWDRIAALARVVEEEGGTLPVEAQRDTLQVLWSVLLEIHNINAELSREMASMEMAKWLFTLIIPGLNIFMAKFVTGYTEQFLGSLVGKVVLGLEALSLIAIFVVFSRLQKLPEVRM
jgi:Flp pilus assembly protein TadB